MSLSIRLMQAADIPAVHAIQCEAYPSLYHEPLETLLSHLESGPQTCLVAQAGDQVAAYILAHPWSGDVPVLHQPLQMRRLCTHLFIHDLAVLPSLRSCGAASALVTSLMEASSQLVLKNIRLVSLAHSVSFWHKHGFRQVEKETPPPCYGAAILMHKSI